MTSIKQPECIGHECPACDGIGGYDADYGRRWVECSKCLGTGNDPAHHDPRQPFVACAS